MVNSSISDKILRDFSANLAKETAEDLPLLSEFKKFLAVMKRINEIMKYPNMIFV